MKDLQPIFTNTQVATSRIIYTPSSFARSSLLHLQEVGTLQALKPHISSRSNLQSYLFLIVLSGSGTLNCEETSILASDNKAKQRNSFQLSKGDCAFIDCQKPYQQSSGTDLWTLKWVHFYGPTMNSIYEKYVERGGKAVFSSKYAAAYEEHLDCIYEIAASASYIKDMQIAEKLTSILTMLMEDAWNPERCLTGRASVSSSAQKKLSVMEIKRYIDEHYTEKLTLDTLAADFFINKHYLSRLFRAQFGITVNGYVNQVRITKAKNLLRFSDLTVEDIGIEVGIPDANYFSRAFRKIEGLSPSEYRKCW